VHGGGTEKGSAVPKVINGLKIEPNG